MLTEINDKTAESTEQDQTARTQSTKSSNVCQCHYTIKTEQVANSQTAFFFSCHVCSTFSIRKIQLNVLEVFNLLLVQIICI